MDLEKALQFAETYVRGYVAYLLAFFGQPADPVSEAEAPDPFKTVLLFALLSAFLGAAFSWHGVSGAFPSGEQVMERISIQFAYWFALALFLFLVLRLMQAPISMMPALLIVLSVTPVAYALGGYASFLWQYIGLLWSEDGGARGQAYWVAVFVQLAISGLYFPTYIRRLAGVGPWRTSGSAVLIMLVIVLVQFFYALATDRLGA